MHPDSPPSRPPNVPSARKGSPSPKKGSPSAKKGSPSAKKGSPSAKKGSPSAKKPPPAAEAEDRDRPAILLLGHGSHINGLSSDSVHDLARKLRATGRHSEVRVAFWKEEPQLRHAFLLVESPEVVAVPFFTSEGYFTDRVLPRELRIDPPVSEVGRVVGPGGGRPPEPDDSVRVHYTRAVGSHPAMAGAVLERARDLLKAEGLLASDGTPSEEVTLVVLGHGTERHPASGEVVERLTERLGRTSEFTAVTCCFLDQDPRMLPVLESVETHRAVLVPFFMAEGWHVGQTIPRDLKLAEGRSQVGTTEVFYADPVGTHPAMVDVVEEMVAEAIEASSGAGVAGKDARDGRAESTRPDPPTAGDAPKGPTGSPALPLPVPARARYAFLSWIDAAGIDAAGAGGPRVEAAGAGRAGIAGAGIAGAGEVEAGEEGGGRGGKEGRIFLETRVRRMEAADPGAESLPRYEIRHADDVDVARSDLERSTEPEWARIVASRTDGGDHRPLKTAPNLRRGWLLDNLSARGVWEAYAHLYPVAPVHWYLGHQGALPVIPFRETAERQTGIYGIVADLEDAEVKATRAETCEGGCLRRVRWPLGGKGGIAEGPASEADVLCPEPCSLFITMARERAAGSESHHDHD